MSIDTDVAADPDSCRSCAHRLAGLGGQLAGARSYLAGQAHLRRDGFDGLAADAYRERCRALARAADGAAERCGGLARALEAYADGIDRVLAVMARAREVARAELVLHGRVIPSPGGYATDRQRRVYRRLAGLVADARAEESRLRHQWLGAIARHSVGPEQPPYPPVGPGGPVPGVPDALRPPWPPPDGRWPDTTAPQPGREPASEPQPEREPGRTPRHDPTTVTDAPRGPGSPPGGDPAAAPGTLVTQPERSAPPAPLESMFVPREDDHDA